MLWDDCKTLGEMIQNYKKSNKVIDSNKINKKWSWTFFLLTDGIDHRITFKNITNSLKAQIKWMVVYDYTNRRFIEYATYTYARWDGDDLVFNVSADNKNIPVEIKIYVQH